MTFTAEVQAFRDTLGIGALLCHRGDPEAKGLVDRANEYFETSVLPGRRFEDAADFNRQLTGWLVQANHRIHAHHQGPPPGSHGRGLGRHAFPPLLPDPSQRWSMRLPPDYYVRADVNDYSVNPRYVGRRIQVRADLDSVVVTCERTEVARHRRCRASHQSIRAPEHARIIRVEEAVAEPDNDDVEERDLSGYDRITEVA